VVGGAISISRLPTLHIASKRANKECPKGRVEQQSWLNQVSCCLPPLSQIPTAKDICCYSLDIELDTQLQTILQSNNNKNNMYWHKNRYEDQWNGIENPDMNPHNYNQFVFDKGAKNM
jgi:hypothetical protein